MARDTEPLQADLWFERIELMASGRLPSVERCLRHAMHLLHLAPTALRKAVGRPPDEGNFEALLADGRLDEAALRLVRPGQLTLDVAAGASVRASITCAILNQEFSATGDTAAAAILDAWTEHLLALRASCGGDRISPAECSSRKSRSEPSRQWH